MKTKLLTIAAMYFGMGHGMAQQFKSVVVAADSGKPLPYARISMVGHEQSAVADQQGKFMISLEPMFDKDTIIISHVGYQHLRKNVKEFREQYWTYWTGDPKIALTAKPFEHKGKFDTLNYIEKKLGNKKGSSSVSFESSEGSPAHELAKLVHTNGEKGFIKAANFAIAGGEQDSVLFMVNIYKAINGMPGETILTEPVYVLHKIEKGVISVDLQQHQIYVEEDFFLSITWRLVGEGKKLVFDSKLGKATTFSRLDGNWEKFSMVDPNFNATLLCKNK